MTEKARTPYPPAGAQPGAVEVDLVAPGLEMTRQHAREPDGRYLVYYHFRRTSEPEAQP